MKKYFIAVFLMLLWLGLVALPAAAASSLTTPPGLSFAEIQITGTGQEFVLIQNNSSSTISDLSMYWLYEHNKASPTGAGASTSTQQLPAASLGRGNFLLLSAGAQNTCGAQVAGRLSVSLPDSEGSLELLASSGGIIASTDTDFVSWNSSNSTITDPVASASPQPVFYRYQSGINYPWQKAFFDTAVACQLDVYNTNTAISTSSLIISTDSPSAAVVTANSSADIPTADIGLIAPQLTELLPNPAGTGNDKTDEFVELYNPNSVAFDLSGFTIEAGLSAKYDYTFDAGTSLPAKTFAAFYSADTGLTLSNTSGQAWLLDPSGNVLGQTDEYTSAKDGYAWVNVGGSWQWTTTPTPGAANIITAPPAGKKASKSSSSTGKVKSAKTTTAALSNSSGSSSGTPSATKMHPLVLAGVGAAGLLYAGYEYRHDLANQFYKFRRNRETRQATRPVA